MAGVTPNSLAALTFAVATSLASALDLIPFGSDWDYMHPTDALDPAIADDDFNTTWFLKTDAFGAYNGPSFVTPAAGFDAGRGPAPIGYGTVTYFQNNGGLATALTPPVEEARYTAYFRHDFTLGVGVEYLALEMIVDDGAVIYIDGVRWQSVNFDDDDTYLSLASRSGDENNPVSIITGIGGLTAGDHTIAVSLHQNSATSSDLGFDLRLSDEGIGSLPFGVIKDGEPATVFSLSEQLSVWTNPADFAFELNNGNPAIMSSKRAALGDNTIPWLVVVDFTARDTSSGSNFEADDRFSATVEVDNGADGPTLLSLIPVALDTDGSGSLNGDEFGAGLAGSQRVDFFRPLVVPIPEGMTGGVVNIDALNDSNSETFAISNVRFIPAAQPPLTVMGQIDFGAGTDFKVYYSSDEWTGTGTAGEFVINDSDERAAILSQPINLAVFPPAQVSLMLNASETSEGSNFDGPATFSAWVEVIDSAEKGWRIDLVNGGLDTDGNRWLTNEEFAPGAEDTELLDIDIPLSAQLPADAVTAQIVIVGAAGSLTETLTISDLKITAADPNTGEFFITGISQAAGGYTITWNSDVGSTYDLQFTADVETTPFATVATLTATGGSSSLIHDPSGEPNGFYRISRRP